MSLILDPNKQFVNIEIYYIEEIKKHGNSVFHFIRSKDDLDNWHEKGYHTREEIATSRTEKSTTPLDTDKIIEKINTSWRRLTWKDQNAIYSKCIHDITGVDGKPIVKFDGITFRDLKLKQCLKKWDLVDETGNQIPVNNDMIDRLPPDVAQELITTYEKVVEPTEEDIKK